MQEKHIGLWITLPCLLFLTFGLVLSSGEAYGEERIPFTYPPFSAKKMPPVFFTHDQHIAYLADKGQDCTACHQMTDEGLAESFANVRNVAPSKQMDYLHATCTECHVKLAKGPRLVDCRTCHSERFASENAANN